jgi:hypothetical protein
MSVLPKLFKVYYSRHSQFTAKPYSTTKHTQPSEKGSRIITTDNGWKLLSFTTTGLAECQHWVLGMGLRAEQPPELVEWLRNEAQPTAALYRKTR